MSLLLRDVRVGYRNRTVLSGLSAQARRGELTVLLGPNGVGKSTLIRTLAGLQPPLAGEIHLDGADLARLTHTERAGRMAVVLTERVSPGLLTARELVGFGRHPHTGFTGALTAHDWERVAWAIDAVGATHLADRDVGELSDGERQRVLTARALAQEPGLLLLDEPSAFLDAPSRVALTGLLRKLATERHLAVVVSTHELELALRVADAVWLLDRTGTLHTGTPEQLALDGTISTTFDTDELEFDPAAGTFLLRPATSGTCRVLGADAPMLARAFARAGWRTVDTGPADVEVRTGPDGYLGLADGRCTPLPDLAAVSDWTRTLHRHQRAVQRADPAQVTSALATAATFSSYFVVEIDDEPTDPLVCMLHDGHDAIIAAVDQVAQRIGVTEQRVAASTLQFDLAARLWSVAIGTLVTGGLVADLDRLRYRLFDGATVRLTLTEPGGWSVTGDDLAPMLIRTVIDGQLRPLHAGLRAVTRISEGLLWGNAAVALIAAIQLITRHDPVHDLAELGRLLLASPTLAGTVDENGTRRSCCLFYRTPTGGTCGNCPLNGATVTKTKEHIR